MAPPQAVRCHHHPWNGYQPAAAVCPSPQDDPLGCQKRGGAGDCKHGAKEAALTQLRVDARKISVLRNGVDTRLFHPVDRAWQRARLGLTGTVLLMVGNLVALKGHDVVLRALREFSGACLLIIGEGREERNLKKLACALGIRDRVRFLGAMPQEQLAESYGAADVLQRLFRNYPDRNLTRRNAERFGWDETTGGQLQWFEGVLGTRGGI